MAPWTTKSSSSVSIKSSTPSSSSKPSRLIDSRRVHEPVMMFQSLESRALESRVSQHAILEVSSDSLQSSTSPPASPLSPTSPFSDLVVETNDGQEQHLSKLNDSSSSIRRAPSPISMYSGLENGLLGSPPKPRPLVKLDKTKKEKPAKKPKPDKLSSLERPPTSPRTSLSSAAIITTALPDKLRSFPMSVKGAKSAKSQKPTNLDSEPDLSTARVNLSRASVWGRPGTADPETPHCPIEESPPVFASQDAPNGHVVVTSREKGAWQERDVQDVLLKLRCLKSK